MQVFQNIFLFDDTIKKNIGFGLEDQEINENQIFKIIEEVQLKKLILDPPESLKIEGPENEVSPKG